MDWDHDVCLSCDKQTQDGEKFCSQACRLADLERAGYSEPPTPASLQTNTSSWDTWHMSSSSTTNVTIQRHHFQLDPPINFSTYRTSSHFESPPASPRSRMLPRPHSTSYFPPQQPAATILSQPPTGRSLTSSPSRSSLSSVSSSLTTTSSSILSEDTINQLRDYSGAFDVTRDWRRRVTLG